jgi:hypothetical protein
MFKFTDINPRVEIQESEYVRLLGLPRSRKLEGRMRELADTALAWYAEKGRPWIRGCEVAELEMSDDGVQIGGDQFSADRLRAVCSAADAHSAVLVAASAGKECEEHGRHLWEEGKPDEYLFFEVLGSAVVEQLVALAGERLCHWAEARRMAVLSLFSPGNGGWDIAEQGKLWNLFQKHFDPPWPGPLEVLESGMLRPKKSHLAVFPLSRDLEKSREFASLLPCENCSLPKCSYRRAAYKALRRPVEIAS